MRSLKRLSGATLMLAFILTCTGGSSASATELYSGGTTLKAGTEVVLTLKSGMSTALKSTGGETLTTCTSSVMEAKLSNNGSATETVKAAASKFTVFGGCVTKVVETGQIEFHALAGKNAQITTKGFRVTWYSPFGETTCDYTGGEGITIGTLTGSTSENATLEVNAVLSGASGNSFLCPVDTKWTAIYLVTSPKPFHATTS